MLGKIFSYPVKCVGATVNVPVSIVKDVVAVGAGAQHPSKSNTEKSIDNLVDAVFGDITKHI